MKLQNENNISKIPAPASKPTQAPTAPIAPNTQMVVVTNKTLFFWVSI